MHTIENKNKIKGKNDIKTFSHKLPHSIKFLHLNYTYDINERV